MSSLESLFCHVDDFCAIFEPQWHLQLLTQGLKSRKRGKSLTLSEIMTILVAFHQKHYCGGQSVAVSRLLKSRERPDYLDHVCVYWRAEFPNLPSYQRES
jgi:hypothetical protein